MDGWTRKSLDSIRRTDTISAIVLAMINAEERVQKIMMN